MWGRKVSSSPEPIHEIAIICPNEYYSGFLESRRALRFAATSTGSVYPSPLIQERPLRTPPPCTASGLTSRMEPIIAQDKTKSSSSPPLRPFHSPRLTPVLYAESIAVRKK